MKKTGILITAAIAIAPFQALAQGGVSDLGSLLSLLKSFLNALVPFIVSLAVVVFLWGVFRYVSSGDDETERQKARSLMLNGVIAIFVMVSLWGLVRLIDNTFNLNDAALAGPELPTLDGTGGGGGFGLPGGINLPFP